MILTTQEKARDSEMHERIMMTTRCIIKVRKKDLTGTNKQMIGGEHIGIMTKLGNHSGFSHIL